MNQIFQKLLAIKILEQSSLLYYSHFLFYLWWNLSNGFNTPLPTKLVSTIFPKCMKSKGIMLTIKSQFNISLTFIRTYFFQLCIFRLLDLDFGKKKQDMKLNFEIVMKRKLLKLTQKEMKTILKSSTQNLNGIKQNLLWTLQELYLCVFVLGEAPTYFNQMPKNLC